jgi:hypothetical protein
MARAAAVPSSVAFHVAVQGSDENSGTAKKPFATLTRAQWAVREAKQRGATGPATVILHGGVYRISRPLAFEPQDSGTAEAPVTYQAAPGERAIIDGGQTITGWKKADGHLWSADLPDVKSGAWHFRQLYVNGQSRTRARIPNQGFLRVANPFLDGNTKIPIFTPSKAFGFASGELKPDWTNLQDVEVTVYHFWRDPHLSVQSVDPVSNIVTFIQTSSIRFTDDTTTNGARYVVENVFEGLDEPGEWYLNRKTGVLYYWPKPGEDMARAEVVAPRSASLLQLRGEPEKQRWVEHLIFSRLDFQHAGFELPAGETSGGQGAVNIPGAVTLTGAQSCRFDRCELRNLGAYAVEIGSGCRNNAFTGNALHHLAAGGFRVGGGDESTSPFMRTSCNEISDNLIHHYGEVFASAVGILLTHTDGNAVMHNHIHHGYYSGISAGWVWGYRQSVSRDNRIEFNHIHNIGQGMLSDMAGIYTLGVSPGSTIRNNIIHDVEANHYCGCGIYLDEGSSHLLVENNWVYDTMSPLLNIHYAKEVTVRNNVFALGREQQLTWGYAEPHKTVYFTGNIVYWKDGDLFFASKKKDEPYAFHVTPVNKSGPVMMTGTFDCDWNLYFNPMVTRDTLKVSGGTWKAWLARGKDLHSQYADPLFMNIEQGDFRLKPESPAWALGFREIDMSTVGPRVVVGPN